MELNSLLEEGKFIEFTDGVRSRKWGISKHEFGYVKDMIEKSELSKAEGYEIAKRACIIGCKLTIDGVTTTKIRKFLDKFNEIKERGKDKFNPSDIAKLKIQLAYAVSRENKLKDVGGVVEMLLNKVDGDYSNFKIVFQYIEGIVAYHKLAGGRD